MVMDLEELKKVLLKPDFDVEKHAADQLLKSGQQGRDIGAYAKDLEEAEHQIDRLLQEQVSTHYEDLISQATGVERLEKHLDMMQSHMTNLVASSERLRAKIREPHRTIRTQTVTLERLQETCDLLRRIIRILQLGKRLKTQLQGGPQEMAKAALSLNELSELWTPDLNSIDVIEQDQRMIFQAKADVERNADGMLVRGMEGQNQNHIGIAVQVFQNLDVLEAKLFKSAETNSNQIKVRLGDALNVKKITFSVEETLKPGSHPGSNQPSGPGKASIPAPGNMATFRAILWNNVETLLDFAFSKTCEIICLQNLLIKKRDTVTHQSFYEILGDKGQILSYFWSKVIQVLTQGFSKASTDSNFLKQALEGEYPKLLRLFNDLWTRLRQTGLDLQSLDPNAKNPFEEKIMDKGLRNVLSGYEKAYLSRSLSRLFDPVNLMFSSGEIPTDSELHQVFKGIASEMNVAMVDQDLSLTVAKNVAKTVKLMCVKCEQILVTDGEASQVVGYPTEGQKKNVAIVNCLTKFRDGVEDIMRNMGISSGHKIEVSIDEALEDVDKQINNALNPLLASIQDAIEAIILTIHNEDFSTDKEEQNAANSDSTSSAMCSLYMKELQGFLSRVSVDFLQDFLCQDIVSENILPLSAKCIDHFILHAGLVRPLGKVGQLRLASDCAQLELALEPLVKDKISTIGKSYTHLRSFRQLLFILPEDVPTFPGLGDSLPVTTALHFLFSKAPKELKSPHESANWSLSRYSQWLDAHPLEQDRLQLIQGTLESYVAGTRARGEKSYAFPYNIMLQVLEKALQ